MSGMKFRPTLAALGFAAMLMGTMSAAQADGDPAKGKVLAYTCHGCHGIPNYRNAFPNYSVPKLGGQHARYLEAALVEYQSGDRAHPTMHAHAASMSAQDRADIAAFFASSPAPAKEVVGTPPPAASTCAACHGPDGVKTQGEEFPILAGQQEDYIEQALKDYKSGKRKNPIMGGIVAGLKDEDIPAIAVFFSRQSALCSTDQVREHGRCE
jgi:cytochrome c553